MRLGIYDRTCVRTRGHLTPIWWAGGMLYRGLRRLDEMHGVASWDEALAILASRDAPISEVQYWGHGRWGGAFVGEDWFGAGDIPRIAKVRDRFAADPLIWFRTCETLGAHRGQAFAAQLANELGARVAGHTYVIHFQQSGLHALAPGLQPHWAPDEGLAEGTADSPERALSSRRTAPQTITCLANTIPDGW